MIPVTDLQAVEIAMAGNIADDMYAQRVKNYWLDKIHNSSARQLESYIWDIAPEAARLCRKVIVSRFGVKLTEAIQTNDLDLGKLERLVSALKVKAENRVGENSFDWDSAQNRLVNNDGSGVLELLRITILLAIIRQLQRQMAGLVG